ncbi:hypothetical protein BDC45DRAFT_602945 [Circinella umbellata]|nr:hypothetical protein BDC45DRAFT_602945 [Circinella umbellata]
MDVQDDIRFLTKTLEKFKKNQRRKSQIVEQTLLVWLRNNSSNDTNVRPTPKTSHSESVRSTTDKHTAKKKSDDPVYKKKKTLKGILSLRNNSKKSVSQQQPSGDSKKVNPSSNPSSSMILILLQWWRALIETVQFLQHTERTRYFDSLIEIVSREEFLYYDHAPTAEILGRNCSNDVKSKWPYLSEYHELLNSTLNYAIVTADTSAVHPGTVIFCAHTLALCFFKVPGLASALLQTLPVEEDTVLSIRKELIGDDDVSAQEYSSYQTRLCKAMPVHLTNCNEDRQLQVPLKSTGHWISRWKTSDRSLFIMFYQKYHINLNAYINAAQGGNDKREPLPIETRNIFLVLSPGYVHFASYLTEKVSSLLRTSVMDEMSRCNEYTAATVSASTAATQHQQTLSSLLHERPSSVAAAKTTAAELPNRPGSPAVLPMVTRTPPITRPSSPTTTTIGLEPAPSTSRSNSSVSTGTPEINVISANTNNINNVDQKQTHTGKPKGLDSATRRYAYCLTSCAIDPAGSSSDNSGRNHHHHKNTFDITAYQDMINVWLRAITKTISWTSPESAFCLIDFFENVIIELQKNHYNGIFPLVDIPFILHVVHLLLVKTDNTIVHMRTLAFVFTNFGFLTQRPELLDMLCNKILLHPYLFERFIIHWNSGVRIFYLQCLFWRIRPLWSFSTVQWGFKDNLKSACDGFKCWNAWNEEQHDDNDPFISGHNQTQMKGDISISEHRKYALEVHLTLETLLASFLQQYTRLDSLLKDLTNRRDRHNAINKLQSNNVEPEPFLPTFRSHLTRAVSPRPSSPSRLSHSSTATLQVQENSPVSLRPGPPPPPPPHDPYLAPPSEHLLGRRTRGFSNNLRRLSRTFLRDIDDEEDRSSESGSSTPPRRYSTSAVLSTPNLSSLNIDKHNSKNKKPAQYYAVPSTYTKLACRQTKNPSSSTDENATGNNDDSFDQGSNHSSSSSTCEDSAYASGRTTPTGLPSILHNTKKSTWSYVPPDVSTANNWRYAPTAHIYASKAIDEMELIMNSSITGSSGGSSSSSSSRRTSTVSSSILKKTTIQTASVPEISVDWPRAWCSS